jgi:hypothetical protein
MTKKGDSKARSAPQKALQLKITLKHIQPPVWRRIVVADTYSLGDLHWVIQKAMGWGNDHPHAFDVGGIEYVGAEVIEFCTGEDLLCDDDFLLSQLIKRRGQRFTYRYDFGDCWTHEILVEKSEVAAGDPPRTRCLDGARACPPEDSGGVAGYGAFLAAKRDPSTPRQHLERWGELEWVLAFDPERFELEFVNRRLNPQPSLLTS